MSKFRVSAFGMSMDGFSAGPNQDLENPLGVGGPALMDWFFPTRTWQAMHGREGGETGVDNRIAEEAMSGVGAWVLGRNMFGPIRGPWLDDAWKGWWGDEPPYHVPVFVLTHHARAPLSMKGGTTFYFVTDGIHSALDQARAAAGKLDIRLGGGASAVRQYLAAQLLDELHIAVRPNVLGKGELLFAGLDLPALGYRAVSHTAGERAMHVAIGKAV